ncbi:MAG TPA: hypothetical protein VJ351_00825, partial [Streptosporangiaceae bacterium]|nr:hypothetical protein [Streptosporangiaceae bacterium]
MSAVRSRFPAVLAALAAGALLVSSGPPALAAPAAAARAAGGAELQGVAALSRSDAWAVGSVIERWNGRRWSLVPGAKSRK